ncbi:hypothetical protein [Amaricoccus macauensis]
MADLEDPQSDEPGIMDPGKTNIQVIYVLYLAASSSRSPCSSAS